MIVRKQIFWEYNFSKTTHWHEREKMNIWNNKGKGLFVGLCTTDIVYYADAFPEENKKIKVNDYARYIGGPAANAAITYAALGGDATLATCLGSSLESKVMIEELQSYGVKVLNYSTENMLPNTASILISQNGQRTIISGQQQFVCNQHYALDAYDFVLFDCNQQEISLDILKQYADKPIVLDAGSWKPNIEQFLQKAQIVIASEVFVNPQGQNVFKMEQCQTAHKIITRGERSVLYENEEIPVPQVKAVDTLGAGDIFHGAFCFAYFNKEKTMRDALEFAAKIASESVRYKGPREWIGNYR